METVTVGRWNRARCPKGIRPTCAVCRKVINPGMRIVVKPFSEVRHEGCHDAVVSTEAARPGRKVYR